MQIVSDKTGARVFLHKIQYFRTVADTGNSSGIIRKLTNSHNSHGIGWRMSGNVLAAQHSQPVLSYVLAQPWVVPAGS